MNPADWLDVVALSAMFFFLVTLTLRSINLARIHSKVVLLKLVKNI